MAVYRADGADAYVSVDLDGLTALFHRRSGATHVLAEPAPQIVELLGSEARDADGLLKALNIAADDEARAIIAARLDELEGVGLISRA